MKLVVPVEKLNDYNGQDIGHSDWFLIDQGSNELLPSEINPEKNCYVWVEEKVERKR